MSLVNYLKYDVHMKRTEIYGDSVRFFEGKPSVTLERWANLFGLGLSGSTAAFRQQLAIKQKIPVLIDPFRQIYFFPTLSPQAVDCHWINASQVKHIKSSGFHSTITFNDASVLVMTIGRRSLIKQLKRCQTMEQLILKTHCSEFWRSSTLILQVNEIKV